MFGRVVRQPKIITYRLPFDHSPLENRRDIKHPVLKTIVADLTFYGTPANIHQLINNIIPYASWLDTLPQANKDYISFTVYRIKQMLSANIIRPETAWTLLHWDWSRMSENAISTDDWVTMRLAFMQEVRNTIGDTELTRGLSLSQFDFYARTGEAEKAQGYHYDQYKKFAQSLIFEDRTMLHTHEAIREEYRQALWLEMEWVKKQTGLEQINLYPRVFQLSYDRAAFNAETLTIIGSIDIFRKAILNQAGYSVDSNFKAEIGHWLFDIFDLSYNWVSELMDRMNLTGYRAQENAQKAAPEMLIFAGGGYFLSSRSRPLPSQFEDFPQEKIKDTEEHIVAERVDCLIRQRLVKACQDPASGVNQTTMFACYRKIGLYIAVLNLEGKSQEEILDKIEKLDMQEINDYYVNYKNKALPIFTEKLGDKSIKVRAFAARAIGQIGSSADIPSLLAQLEKGEDKNVVAEIYGALGLLGNESVVPLLTAALAEKYQKEEIKQRICTALAKIGSPSALPALEAEIERSKKSYSFGFSAQTRASAAEAIISIKGLETTSKEYQTLHAYTLVALKAWKELEALGEQALDALATAAICFDDAARILCKTKTPLTLATIEAALDKAISPGFIRAIGNLRETTFIPKLEKLLNEPNGLIRSEAAKALIKTKGLNPPDENHENLMAYVYFQDGQWQQFKTCGESAVPVLTAALKDNDPVIQGKAIDLTREMQLFVLQSELEKLLTSREFQVRSKAAGALIKIRNLAAGSKDYNQLYAYQLLGNGRWKEARALKKDALPALHAALSDANYSLFYQLAEIFADIGDRPMLDRLCYKLTQFSDYRFIISGPVLMAIQKLAEKHKDCDQMETLLNKIMTGESVVNAIKAAEILIQLKKLQTGDQDYFRLQAYVLLGQERWATLESLGTNEETQAAAIPALRHALLSEQAAVRAKAAAVLMHIQKLKNDSPAYKELQAHIYIYQRQWSKINELGAAALPAIESALKDKETQIRGYAAAKKVDILEIPSGSDEYNALRAYWIFAKHNWEEISLLGFSAEKALKAAFLDKDPYYRGQAARLLQQINEKEYSQNYQKLGHQTFYEKLYLAEQLLGEEKWEELVALAEYAVPALEAALQFDHGKHLGKVAESLVKIRGLKPGMPDYNALAAYFNTKIRYCTKTGLDAVPALKNEKSCAAVDHEDFLANWQLFHLLQPKKESFEYKQLKAFHFIYALLPKYLRPFGEEAIPALEKKLMFPDHKHRAIAAELLGDLHCRSVVPILEPFLKDSSPLVRAKVARALMKARELEADSPAYQELLAHELIYQKKWASVQELGERARVALQTAVKGDGFFIRRKARQLLKY